MPKRDKSRNDTSLATFKRLSKALTLAAAAALLALTACDTSVSGTVQDKRHHRGDLGVMVRELCIGDSKDTCTWYHLRGKAARGWYGRCDIGERYPDCRALIRP